MNPMEIVCAYFVDSTIRGYDQYEEIWEASYGEVLNCVRETGNFLLFL